MIQFYTGLRPKEAKDIQMCEINFKENLLYIPAENNKQRNQDMMPIQDFLMHRIKAYIKIRDKFFINSPFLFPSTWSAERPVYRGTLMRAFIDAIEFAGYKQTSYIDKKGHKRNNLSIYSLRHSFGTFAMHSLKDTKQVAKLLRHYDPQCRSTYIYMHTEQSFSRKQLLDKVSFK
jgi:integrase